MKKMKKKKCGQQTRKNAAKKKTQKRKGTERKKDERKGDGRRRREKGWESNLVVVTHCWCWCWCCWRFGNKRVLQRIAASRVPPPGSQHTEQR
jgi:hypothetical protein